MEIKSDLRWKHAGGAEVTAEMKSSYIPTALSVSTFLFFCFLPLGSQGVHLTSNFHMDDHLQDNVKND